MSKFLGIDVSNHQGVIDWAKVKKAGVDFAIIRCGYGGNIAKQDDKQFARNVQECEKHGIPYGIYLYSYATSILEAYDEAQHVLRLLEGLKPTYPIYYDLEDASTTGKCSNSTILAIAKEFVKTLENAGYWVGIYASKHWFTTKLTNEWYDSKARWVAQYNSKCTYDGSYQMWQYTSSGEVDGIEGKVDMNECYVDYPTLVKQAEKNGWKKATETKPTAKPNVKPPTTVKSYKKGDAITLNKTPIYISKSSKKAVGKKTGKYYIYDGIKLNGRYRITNKKANCGKKPAALFVSGWVKI